MRSLNLKASFITLLSLLLITACSPSSVPLGVKFYLGYQDTVRIQQTGLRITLVKVEDSRCPPLAVCVWAGAAKITLAIGNGESDANKTEVDLILSGTSPATVNYKDFTISLSEVSTSPKVSGPTEQKHYRVQLEVNKAKVDSDWDKNRNLWTSAGIDDYSFTYRQICFCVNNDPINIRVQDNKVVAATNETTDAPVPAGQLVHLRTINGLFDLIAEVAQRPKTVMEVKYDEKLGYPLQISIDYYPMAADDEITHQVSNFLPLKTVETTK